MHRDRDLLPWISSGLVMAGIAIIIGAGSIQSTASKNPHARNPTAEPILSAPATSVAAALSAAPPIAEPAVLSEPPQSADVQMTAPSSEPKAHIWECTTKGVKTFSDNPCGEKSALREVGPINTMAATPLDRYTRVNAPDPRYPPTYVNENAYEQEPYSEPPAADSYDSYPVIQGFAYLPRVRARHPHRPIHHHPGMPVRRN
jgi:hypothetical protein